ncbi:MAG: AI-2E family transporter [Thermoanaerobaculia bacterium]|nr:AI-2E family transporter [Thermoanaerobaculia bacterium]
MTSPPASRFYQIFSFVVLALAMGFFAFRILEPFFAAIAWTIVLGAGFYTPWKWLSSKMPKSPNGAATLMSLGVALVFLLPATVLAIVLINQAADAIGLLGNELSKRNVRSVDDFIHIPPVTRVLDLIHEKTGMTAADLQAKGVEALGRISSSLAQMSGGFLKGILDAMMTFALTIFLLFFFFRDGDAWGAAAFGALPIHDKSRKKLMVGLRSMLQGIFRGSLLCSLVQGITGGIGWALAGLPSAAVAGAAMALFSLLPLGGTALIWGPGAIWLWIAGHKGAAIFLVVWGVVVVSFLADNVLRPLLIGGGAELHTLVVFLGVFGGIGAFGLLGIFFGPIILALVTTMLDILREEARLVSPSEPDA